MPYKKTNEAYFGDSFNRPYTLAFCTADGEQYSAVANNLMVEHDLSGSCTFSADIVDGSLFSVAKGCSTQTDGISARIESDVSALVSEVKDLRARLHDLEQHLAPKNSRARIRSELKTLAYNREI